MLYTSNFTLCVCLTAMAEWSKALAGPGSQPATLKIIFFFFLFLSIYFGLFKVSPLRARLCRVLFLSTTYTGSESSCFITRPPSWIFYDRSFNSVRSLFFREHHVPSPTKTFLTLTCLFFTSRYALMDDSHTRSVANTQCPMARFLSCTLIFDLCV